MQKNNRFKFLILVIALTAAGCGAKYGCKTPDGISCRSMTAIYYGHGGNPSVSDKKDGRGETMREQYMTPEVLHGPTPVRKTPRVIRIWLAPWVDENEDLHQPGYIYTEIPERKWVMGEYVRDLSSNPGGLSPLPPPLSQQEAMAEVDKGREAIEKAKEPPAAPEGAPPLPDVLR